MSNETTAIVVMNNHANYLQAKQKQLDEWIAPGAGIPADALVRFALHDLNSNEKLRECTPLSIYLALLACAVSGLEPGPMKGEAYLVPRRNKYKHGESEVWIAEAQFMVGWRGIKRQAARAGVMVVANVVRERDVYRHNLGTAQELVHEPALTNPGAVIGAYAWAKTREGLEIEWMNMDDLTKVRSSAGQNSSAWSAWPDQMQRKSPLRRLGKRIPLNADYYKGQMIELAGDLGQSQAAVLDTMTDGAAASLQAEEIARAVRFQPAALPARGGATVQVPAAVTEGTKATAPSKGKAASGPKPPIDVQSAPSPSAATSSAGAEPSKLDTAVAKVEEKRATPTSTSSPVPATPAVSSPPSSTTASPANPTTAGSSAPAAQPQGQPDAPDESFGGTEDPVDTAPPEYSLVGFKAWLTTQRSRKQLKEGKGPWLQWSKKEWPNGAPEATEMQDAYVRRLAELPDA